MLTVSPESISTPYGSIVPSRVTYWGSTGDSSTSVGTGVATTILFGGIGLLGFLGKNHEYSFTINGFNAEGKKISAQIAFKNDKPAKRLMSELTSLTGLGMGQTRSSQEILAAESGQELNLNSLPESKDANLINTKPDRQTAAGRNCWSDYLRKNPAVDAWSKANPSQAQQNKKRFDDC